MKYTLPILSLAVALSLPAAATTYTVTTPGLTFSPASLTISVGDTVIFSLGGSHNAVEVSQATWDANGNTSNGGFAVPFGGGTVVFTTPGTRYYVCVPHAQFGMKGTITVNEVTGVQEASGTYPASLQLLQNYPNPFNPVTTFRFSVPEGTPREVTLTVSDMLGRTVTTIVSGTLTPGVYTRTWDASALSSGTYVYRLQVGSTMLTRKLLFLK